MSSGHSVVAQACTGRQNEAAYMLLRAMHRSAGISDLACARSAKACLPKAWPADSTHTHLEKQ
jgi:hypothetical protein